jgi:hypothetical protein
MVYYIGLVLWIIGLAGFLFVADEEKKIGKWVVYLITIAGITCYSIGAGINKQEDIYNALTRDVNLQQVVVQGQNDFRAQVQLTYKNGKLESVKLVPKTTVVSEPMKAEASDSKSETAKQ